MKELKFFDRDAILNANDTVTEEVAIPEWGCKVMVKGMTGAERDAFEASIVDVTGKNPRMKPENIRAKLIVKTVVDPASLQPMFTPGDIEALGRKSAAALSRIYDVASRLSGLSKEDMDELEKNSGTDQSDTLPTA